ncbi:MAG: fatty acid desaturase [Cyanobacteria bacterium]|nr:fatty acid desaturase [Cyanobacteriota bacterium]MDA0866481.1 fatty acid desaturase [Cyanobacteriota bacterium]
MTYPETITPDTAPSEDWQLCPHHLLSTPALKALNQRSNGWGLLQLAAHLTVLGMSGYGWSQGWSQGPSWWAGLALVVYGFSLATMFAPVHEGVHRTAFASQTLNDAVAWGAGVLSFYNSTFYRRYHQWHHRYTRIAGKDPELEDVQPKTLGTYLWQVSGVPWWLGKLRGHWQLAWGQTAAMPYIPDSARTAVRRSTGLQLAVYGVAIALSIGFQRPWFLQYWLLPLAIGQPLLRFILLAEHTGCSRDGNALTNTRTTLTLWPIRLLMWNMPFHAEHHLYPSIPFHALGKAHQQLAPHFSHVDSGYLAVNRRIVSGFGQSVA